MPLDAAEPDDLLAFLWQAEVSVVWAMPGTRWSQVLTSAWFRSVEPRWTVIVHPALQHPDRLCSVLLWPRGDPRPAARQLVVAFPDQAGWGWQVADATSLLATVTYLQRVVARPVSDGPEVLAHQVLTELTAMGEHPLLLARTGGDKPPDVLAGQSPQVAWMRPLTIREERQKYLHQYIHLSYPLEACLRLPLPHGPGESSSTGRAYDGQRPGIWRVQAERAGSVFDGTLLPSCLDGVWMTTPQVQCCREIGYQVQVCEGFFWSQSQPVLQPWATALWQAAERTHVPSPLFKHEQGRTNTVSSITLLARLGLAHLAHEQPQWWAQIVGGSRQVLFAHLVRLVKRGIMPVLLSGDALWVVSNDPHPRTAAPSLLDARPWHGYRVGYPVPLPLSSQVRELLHGTRSPEQVATLLDGLAHEDAHVPI